MPVREKIRVAVRFRPLNKKERDSDNDLKIKFDTENNIVDVIHPYHDKQQYILDRVFDETTTQETIFDSMVKNAVELVCKGYNATIFAYGATSTGKTFTMFGHESGKQELRGIIPRTCEMLFDVIKNKEETVDTLIKCSFVEIYQERLRDLLDTRKSWADNLPVEYNPALHIRQHDKKGVYVQGLIEKFVYTADDILEIIQEGALQRSVTSTALNSVSSRSHSVLTIFVTQILADGSECHSKLHLIDLAGSENVGKSEVQGTALNEAKMINKSLSSLGNVINALTEHGREHIPYRDSKLTYLLQDSLGGNSKTIVIVTASPSIMSYSETVSTLKFAIRVSEIKNKPKINKNESRANLLRTIESLRKRIVQLESTCEDSQIIIKAVENSSKENSEITLLRTKCERLEKKIENTSLELEKEYERYKQLKETFEKQRDLSLAVSKKLYVETLRNKKLANQLELFDFIYRSLEEASQFTPELLSMIINKNKLKLQATYTPTPTAVDFQPEIDNI